MTLGPCLDLTERKKNVPPIRNTVKTIAEIIRIRLRLKKPAAEGRAVAKSRGVKFGRKRKYDKFQVAEVMKKKSEGLGLGTIAKSLGMSRSMVQRIVKQEVAV